MADLAANWAFTEEFSAPADAAQRARARADEFGLPTPSAGTCALLTVLAAACRAKSAVEIGTSAGVGALALLAGMPPTAIITSIDAEAEFQRAAREAFAEAGIPPGRTRLINSRPAEVLPRLADAAYDIVLLGGARADYMDRLAEALRLLRPGGILAVDGALASGNVPDPARRDPVTVTVRELDRTMRDTEGYAVALVPAGDGLLVAVKR
ncbi:MAG: class I SAM-dependent methyltransferase [Bifidobacteriaceae bacterium]|jgi:predicted O-methyltransferase YrrM|nr:class I SAM-dependent methyltransferase [Bifidobacteriaceae bacterium]